jgi:hypothetical protein
MFLGKPQNSLFAPFAWLDEHCCVTKSGEVAIACKLDDAIDFECVTDTMLESQHDRILAALQALPEEIRVITYLVKTEGAEVTAENHPNEVVAETLRNRAKYLSNGKLSTISLYLVLVYEPKRFFTANQQNSILKISQKKLGLYTKRLYSALRQLRETVSDLLGISVLQRPDVFRFLRFLTTFDSELAASEPDQFDDYIDTWITGSMATIHRDGIRLHRSRPEVLTMRKLPKATFPNVLREMLSVEGDFVLCSQFKRESTEKALSFVRSAETHWYWMQYIKSPQTLIQVMMNRGEKADIVPDQAATERVEELGACAKSLIKGEVHGWFQFTAVVFGRKEQIEPTSTQLIKIVGNQLGSLVRETYYAAGPYASLVPGTTPRYREQFRKRQRKLALSQFVDLALIYNHSAGEKTNPITRKPALLTLVTSDKTPYAFNLVPPRSPNKGVLLLGVMGSGKSVFSQLCIDHSMKDGAYVLILDGLGGSYKTLTAKHDGSYFDLDPESDWPFTFNPFQVPDSKKNRQYLSMLVRLCMATGGYKANAIKNQIVYKEVGRVLELPIQQRRISALQLPNEIAAYLAPWIGDGQYGNVFDNAEDTLRLGRFQCIDFSGLMEFKDVVQPLLFHIFRCWNQLIYDNSKLTIEKDMWVDEGWNMISYPAARKYIQAAARTWRKRHGGLVLATQSMVELEQSKMLSLVNELCPLKLLLTNPGADFAEYARVFKLNEKEVELYSKLNTPGSGLMKSSNLSKIFHTPLDAEAYWTYANDPHSNEKRDAAMAKHGDLNKALKALAKGA